MADKLLRNFFRRSGGREVIEEQFHFRHTANESSVEPAVTLKIQHALR